MTDDALDPRDAVLELLLDSDADPHRRDELRALVERDPAAHAELVEFERIDDLLRTAGPMLEPSDDLMARVFAVPDEAREEADVPWELAAVADDPQAGPDDSFEGELAPPAPDGPTLLADLMPPSRRPMRPERTNGRSERGGFFRNIVVWRAATVVAAAAAIALGVVAFTGDDDAGPSTDAAATVTVTSPPESSATPAGAEVALTNAEGETAQSSVVAAPGALGQERVIHITVTGLDPKGTNVYTLWIARAPNRRIAIGTFKPDAQGTIDADVVVPALPKTYKGLWLTREKPNGVKGWSKDWVFKGQLAGQA